MYPDPSPPTFGPFPSVSGQHAAEWPTWYALIQSHKIHAMNICTGQESGLVGSILDPPTYLLDYGHAFVRFVHPGPIPALNAVAGAWNAHKVAMDNWRTESNAFNSLMASIFKSLDLSALSLFLEPLCKRYNMDSANFIVVMQREYGVADTEVISKWITSLQESMTPASSVRDLVTFHREVHSKLNIARGYVIHEDNVVRGLLSATKFTPFRTSII
jgi:hypothetical protein